MKMLLIFVGFMLFNFMTNMGPNAQTYLLAGEVFPTAIRGKGAGFAASVAKVGACTTAFLFPILLVDLARPRFCTSWSSRRCWARSSPGRSGSRRRASVLMRSGPRPRRAYRKAPTCNRRRRWRGCRPTVRRRRGVTSTRRADPTASRGTDVLGQPSPTRPRGRGISRHRLSARPPRPSADATARIVCACGFPCAAARCRARRCLRE
ncbi:MAG: MFS transporter [Xanthobacteraceae bacterium]